MYIRSDGYLIIIRNKENFKEVPIIIDENIALPAGSIADSISSKYDKFNIQSNAHRIPYVGGTGGYKEKGVTIKVMDKQAQEEQEKKRKEEESKNANEEMQDDERGGQVIAESTTKPKSKTH